MSSPNILIVEDADEIAHIVAMTLKRIGLETSHADRGSIAVELIDAQKPDLILLDLNLPGMMGWEILDYAKTQYGDGSFAVIVMTANSDSANRLIGKFQEVQQYIVKPFTPKQLIEAVETVLGMNNS